MITKLIPTPSMRDFLEEKFMKPLNISSYKLAKDIKVPYSRVHDILAGKRKVTADTSMRLGKYFGVSPKFFLNLQMDIDLRNAKQKNAAILAQIKALPKKTIKRNKIKSSFLAQCYYK